MNNDVIEIESIPTKIKYKDIVWVPESNNSHNDYHAIKENYFVKWLRDKKPGDIFTLEDFYKVCPKHKTDAGCKRRLDKIISILIKEGKIDMWTKKDEFRVIKI